MARIILIECNSGWAIPYDTKEEADVAAFKFIRDALGPLARDCKTPEELQQLSEELADGSIFTYELGGEYLQVNEGRAPGQDYLDIILQEEGEAGVAATFSSSDRENFTFPIPIAPDPDANTGSGDPIILLTKGVASGVRVKGYTAKIVDYHQYLGGTDVTEEEN